MADDSWGQKNLVRYLILVTAVMILTSWRPGSCQSSSAGSSSNCSHSYQLSASAEQDRRCCFQVTPSLPSTAGSCSTLMDILYLHNDIIPAGDCLELVFAPGEYVLPSPLPQVLVQYSVVMTAPQGGVDVVCGGEGGGCGGEGEGEGGRLGVVEEGEDGEIVAMMVFNGTQREDMSVEIRGITFSDCTKQLQFDELGSLSVNNCSFM